MVLNGFSGGERHKNAHEKVHNSDDNVVVYFFIVNDDLGEWRPARPVRFVELLFYFVNGLNSAQCAYVRINNFVNVAADGHKTTHSNGKCNRKQSKDFEWFVLNHSVTLELSSRQLSCLFPHQLMASKVNTINDVHVTRTTNGVYEGETRGASLHATSESARENGNGKKGE